MQRLRFISPMAQITDVTVGAVNDGMPLVYDEIYTVSNELADKLLVNTEDWRLLSPPREKVTANEDETTELPVVEAETDSDHE